MEGVQGEAEPKRAAGSENTPRKFILKLVCSALGKHVLKLKIIKDHLAQPSRVQRAGCVLRTTES